MSPVTVSSAGLFIDHLPPECLSVDILLDGHRVWTLESSSMLGAEQEHVEWPPQLLPFLTGRSTVSIVNSASGAELFREDVHFSDLPARTLVANRHGTRLVINKWGSLAPDLSALPPEALQELLINAHALIADLQDFGLRPFVVGGTLLGAVREGKLLPHDDDADIAYLSQYTNPADIAKESFELGHHLDDLGYEYVRHSAAHIQTVFRDADGSIQFHIDVFSAFFTEDGMINQPFHVRGAMQQNQMLPFSNVSIDGRSFPAPGDHEAWLTLNYDANWRTPIPGYRLLTPSATERRFDNWFGGFNFRREFWDSWFEDGKGYLPWESGSAWLANRDLESLNFLELGAGEGQLSRKIADLYPGRRIIASDYSSSANTVARERSADTQVEYRHLNLYRFSSVGIVVDAKISGPFDVTANHLLEQVGHHGRTNALRIFRMALRSGGRAYATSYSAHSRDVSAGDPTTWHLTQEDLHIEAQKLGMSTNFFQIDAAMGEENRIPYGVQFTLLAS